MNVSLLPYNVITQCVRQLHGFAVAERTALELAGEIGNAVAPAIFIGEVVHHLGHGHAGADDVGFDFVATSYSNFLLRSVTNSVRQITMPIRHKVLFWGKRPSAEIAARDVLVVGDTLNFCCFVCVFVNE